MRPRWSTLKKARPATQPFTPRERRAEAREVALGAAQVPVPALELPEPAREGRGALRSRTGSGTVPSTVTEAPCASATRRHALERSEVRAAQPHPHVHALRGPVRSRASVESAESAARGSRESGDGVVALGEPVLERDGGHLEAGLPDVAGACGAHRHPFVTSSGKCQAAVARTIPARSERKNGSEPVKLTSSDPLRPSSAATAAQAAPVELVPRDLGPLPAQVTEGVAARRQLPRAVDGSPRRKARARRAFLVAALRGEGISARGTAQKPPGTSATSSRMVRIARS